MNKTTNEIEDARLTIVTQEGKVAYWDDSAGWWEDEDQENFEIVLVV